MLPTLRDYQVRDLEAIREAFKYHRAVLLQQPCGSGKGTLASYIVKSAAQKGNRVIFMVDRRSLVDDMSDRIKRLDVPHGVIMATDSRRAPWEPIQVASIDTITRRDTPPAADILIVDEARFSISAKWRKVFDKYPNARILGLDATPARTSGEGLGRSSGGIYDHMVVGPSAQELINKGHLVRSHVIAPPPVAAPSRVVAGEFPAGAVSAACDTNQIIGDVVKQWKKHASDRKTVGFGADQKHCLHMAEMFREEGIEATTVFDSTPTLERRRLWSDFNSGTLRILISVGVIGYGVDFPICKAIIDAAHTMSLSKAIQRWARGSRPFSGYDYFVLLDHVGNIDRRSPLAPNGFGFYEDDRIWSLEGRAVRSPEDGDDMSAGMVTCPKCYHRFRYGKKECPGCGFAITVKHRIMTVVEEELVERKRAEQKTMAIEEWRTKLTDEDKRRKYDEWRIKGKKRGYKNQWADLCWKRVFGSWPSKEWRNSPIPEEATF
jgi:superfamily II DNA or RNA helicase